MNPNRFLNFGGGAGGADASGHSTGGSAGGSGNFLFDIIRVSRNFQCNSELHHHQLINSNQNHANLQEIVSASRASLLALFLY